MLRNYFFFFILISAIILLAQNATAVTEAPQTLPQAENDIRGIITNFPQALGWVWTQALGVWQNFWDSYVKQPASYMWDNIVEFLNQQFGDKTSIQKEFEKEKEELKKDVPESTKGLWDRFLEIIK